MLHKLFDLIHIVPDQVLSWVGGNMGATLGRDTADRGERVFMGGVHAGKGAITPRNLTPRSLKRGGKEAGGSGSTTPNIGSD